MALQDRLRKRDRSRVIGAHQHVPEVTHGQGRAVVIEVNIQELQGDSHLMRLDIWTNARSGREQVRIDHRQQVHVHVLSLHLSGERVADQPAHRAPDQSIRPSGLYAPDLGQVVGGDLVDAAWKRSRAAQPARLQAIHGYRAIEVRQQIGEAEADAGDRMHTKEGARFARVALAQRQEHAQRINEVPAETIDLR